ncbi:MAG: FKBP-type peptidyl-prolyl cis-trans isomerase [Eubacterium sp.]|nr:FKBP-type peptidyl-prolyl cis-trans isomerase [Eubacterium sp.]
MFKKIMAIALTLVMAVGVLVGCGSGDGSGKATTEEGEIKLAPYKGLVVYKEDVKVTDDAYKSTLNSMLEQDSQTKTIKKGTVKKDSTANVDFSGKIMVNGKKVKFEGGEGKGTEINLATDAGNYIEGFTKALIGHKVGDKFTKKLKFPKSYNQTTKIGKKNVKLAGKDVWFTYKVNSLSKTTKPKLTDKYIAKKFKAFGIKSVKEFEKWAKNQMRISNIINKVWTNFQDKCKVISYNKSQKESAKKEYESQFEANLQQQYGADKKTYLEAASMSEKDWEKQINEQVESSLKSKMIVKAIAEKEGLNLTDAEYKKEAETLAEQNSAKVSELESQYGRDEIEYSVLFQRVQEFIADHVKMKKGHEPTTTPKPNFSSKDAEKKANSKAKTTTKAKKK